MHVGVRHAYIVLILRGPLQLFGCSLKKIICVAWLVQYLIFQENGCLLCLRTV